MQNLLLAPSFIRTKSICIVRIYSHYLRKFCSELCSHLLKTHNNPWGTMPFNSPFSQLGVIMWLRGFSGNAADVKEVQKRRGGRREKVQKQFRHRLCFSTIGRNPSRCILQFQNATVSFFFLFLNKDSVFCQIKKKKDGLVASMIADYKGHQWTSFHLDLNLASLPIFHVSELH